MSGSSQDTVQLPRPGSFADTFFSTSADPLALAFGAETHQGRVRSNNEDQFAVIERQRSASVRLSSLPRDELELPDDRSYVLVVADGIGGAKSGEVASRLAIESMLELSGQATSWVMKLTNADAQQIEQRVHAYLQRMQKTLQESGQVDPRLEGMGTTWTSAHLFPTHAVIVHLGDSRAYLFRFGRLVQLTRDDTMAQAWIDKGMAPESVRKFRHVLVNNLGGDRDEVAAQVRLIDFRPGDQLLLCTDGLYDMVAEDRIAQVLQETADPQAACTTLVQLALEAGGKDNVTVVLAKAAPIPESTPTPPK